MPIPDLSSRRGQDAGKQLEHSGLPASRRSDQGRDPTRLQNYIDRPDLRGRPIPVMQPSRQTTPTATAVRIVVADRLGLQDLIVGIRIPVMSSFQPYPCVPSPMSCFHISLFPASDFRNASCTTAASNAFRDDHNRLLRPLIPHPRLHGRPSCPHSFPCRHRHRLLAHPWQARRA